MKIQTFRSRLGQKRSRPIHRSNEKNEESDQKRFKKDTEAIAYSNFL